MKRIKDGFETQSPRTGLPIENSAYLDPPNKIHVDGDRPLGSIRIEQGAIRCHLADLEEVKLCVEGILFSPLRLEIRRQVL